ncbi:unnamed protein product (macronuclear) [Paramecium tetraurelia]|uniref:dCMP deaminase n=1 Tax=Paramecium tetraurelia TaxID=5888 RepID=A0BRH0_PARTE|nr:uncharacterized protein GSPATT00031368001 [Paramecium tetraurelia]CAK61137.1 unnamed protein product [Paramecium tetraurelia]|eukprot:XP_001428535.1 hypothetical protein (macronuclear) [Paramecium tetraurelia strain d4-2]
MHSNNNQGLIIGLCGRLGSGKEEVAQIISKYQGTECQVISITETMNIREFLDDTLKMMQEKQMGLDLSCYNTNQLEELEKLLKETRDQHFHPHSTKQKLESCLTYNPRHQILYPITDKYELELLYQRNYFHLIAVEAPIIKRYENFMKKYQLNIPLDLFCIIDDVISDNISEFMHKAKVQIGNVGDQKDLLISFYKKYQDIFRPIRPNWNQYFMHLANVVKQRSNCMKRAVGVVIVKDSRIVATGYNGTPYGKQNCWEKGCDRCNQNTKQGVDLEKCFCFHAEESAILEIGTKKSKNMVMYTTLFPCLQCTKIILSTKIDKIYYEEDYDKSAAKSELHKYVKVEQIDSSHYVH